MRAALVPLFLTLSCASLPGAETGPPPWVDVDLARSPFEEVEVRWKERLGTHYVYRDVTGDYRATRGELARLLSDARRLQLAIQGPGFCLFYDDPGEVPVDTLRSRVCLPVDQGTTRGGPWEFDQLPTATVGYAVVEGDRATVPLAYPAVFAFLDRNGWVVDGPVREIDLFDPGARGEPWTEVQVPWRSGR